MIPVDPRRGIKIDNKTSKGISYLMLGMVTDITYPDFLELLAYWLTSKMEEFRVLVSKTDLISAIYANLLGCFFLNTKT